MRQTTSQANDFAPVVRDQRVHFLHPHVTDPPAMTAEVTALATGRSRVWFLASHWRRDLGAVGPGFRAAGLELTHTWRRPGAVLQLWGSQSG